MHTSEVRVFLIAVAMFAAAPAPAAASPSSDFKKAAKSAVKGPGAQSKAGVKQLKADLKAAAAGYAASTLGAGAAVAQAVAAVTSERDTVADTALAAVTDLAAGGASILDAAAVAEPGADFRAGGRGIWDDAVGAIEGVLDANDAAVAAAFAKFVSDMQKAADKRGDVIDVRFRVPAHDETFRAVEPPGIAATRALDREPPQVAIAVRFVETNQLAALDIGVRFDGASLDILGSSTAAESLNFGTLNPGAGGIATGSFSLAGLANPNGFLSVFIDGLPQQSALVTLSAPRLTATPPGVNDIGIDFLKDLNVSGKSFAGSASGSLAQFARNLASHVAAVTRGVASADLAVRTGFGNLRDTRNTLSMGFANSFAGPIASARTALQGGGFVQADLSAAFAPDAVSVYGTAARSFGAIFTNADAAATKQYDSFLSKIGALADKKNEAIGFGAILGNTPNFVAPVLSLDAGTPAQLLTDVQITDGVVIRLHPAVGPDTFSTFLLTQVDNSAPLAYVTTVVNVPDGNSIVIGGLADTSGVGRSDFPLLGDTPVLGWLFRGKSMKSQRESLLILTKPTLINADE